MCISTPHAPPAPPPPALRQTPKAPTQVAQDPANEADRRRRGYAAMMFAGNTGAASTTSGAPSITGV